MNDELIVGMRNIAEFFKLKKVDTIRQWEERYHLPVRRDPSGRVYAVASELLRWLVIYDDERRAGKVKQTYRGAVKIMMDRKKERIERLMNE